MYNKMNEPNIPDNTRGWDAIDIFLFSNGQEYSPPRKYHLLSDDLKWWDNTKTFLARSQYGSIHSAIDIYSLDGKKIEGPLELRNAAAYVAVKPPDAFIHAGYENYLLKASRSREKRHEKLSNSNETPKTGKTEMILDITRIAQVEEIVSLEMVEKIIPDNAVVIVPTEQKMEKPQLSKLNSAKTDKLYPKKKSNECEKMPLLKNNNLCSSKCNNSNRNYTKSKNSSSVPQKRNNKNQEMPVKCSRRSKIPTRENSVASKANSKTGKLEISDILNDPLDTNNLNNNNKRNEFVKRISDNEPTVDPNICTENSCDFQPIFQGTDRKTTIDVNSMKTSIELVNDCKLQNEEQINLQNLMVPINDNKGNINIQIRIKLEDFTSPLHSEGGHLTSVTSVITLIKKERASQVNIDVILGKDIFTFNKNTYLNEKSLESNVIRHEDYNILNDQEMFIHCTCGKLYPRPNVLSNSSLNHKDTLDLPKGYNGNSLESCCKCNLNQEKNDMVNKGIKKSTSNSLILSPPKDVNVNSENITKTDGSVVQKDPNLFPLADTTTAKSAIVSSKEFDEKCTQTEWSNILLQAKCHEDGRYTFHLPTLAVLKEYNFYQI